MSLNLSESSIKNFCCLAICLSRGVNIATGISKSCLINFLFLVLSKNIENMHRTVKMKANFLLKNHFRGDFVCFKYNNQRDKVAFFEKVLYVNFIFLNCF